MDAAGRSRLRSVCDAAHKVALRSGHYARKFQFLYFVVTFEAADSIRAGDAVRCDAMCDEAAADSIRAGDAVRCDAMRCDV